MKKEKNICGEVCIMFMCKKGNKRCVEGDFKNIRYRWESGWNKLGMRGVSVFVNVICLIFFVICYIFIYSNN